MADRADPHICYEKSVQSPEAEVDFILAEFKRLRRRSPALIREDFCGTAAVCCEWARRKPAHRATGVDLDKPTLEWAFAHQLSRLTNPQRARVTLLNQNVLNVKTPPVDAVLAMNFSYYLFKERGQLRAYFKRVRAALKPDGVFFLDAYGGYDAFRAMKEPRAIDKRMTYIWDQADYNPITGDATCRIHFKFADGSRLTNAFEYHWRLWTIPEVRELLHEAGFKKTTVYWEGEDKNGEGDGNFKPAEKAAPDAGWIAYLTAQK